MDRMRKGDPLDMNLKAYRGMVPVDRPIADLDFVIAYEEDLNKLFGFRDAGIWRG